MKTFKMRAECQADLGRFLTEVGVISFNATLIKSGFPDVEAEFIAYGDLNSLRIELAKIVDGHVMLESLNYSDKYTGERYYR